MRKLKMDTTPAFSLTERMKRLQERSIRLAVSGKRNLYTANEPQLVYHWSDAGQAIAPQSGDGKFKGMSLGDHACRVDIGMDFPALGDVPSKKHGYRRDAENWAADFAFLLEHSPAEIHPDETIVGEFN